MADKAKLFLTRGRLFAFDNCNGFSAKYERGFEKTQVTKALKSVFGKFPLLSCCIESEEDGSAFLKESAVAPVAEFIEGEPEKLCDELVGRGLFFKERLFGFYIINNNTLFILGHRAVSDARALMYIASEFLRFYENAQVSFEPVEAEVFSDIFSLPSNVFSPVIERLASDLEVGWQKKTRVFTADDYCAAREKYFREKSSETELTAVLDEDELDALKAFAGEEEVDASSVVAYAFFNGLNDALQGKRKFKKLNVVSNGRVFFPKDEKYKISALDGVVTVSAGQKKNAVKIPSEKLRRFHGGIYKRVTSSFTVFYNDVLSAKLSPSFCDSSYMFAAGLWSHKYSKRLAVTYGCADEVMGEFSSFNLEQSHWAGLEGFGAVRIYEPLKMRSASSVCFVIRGGRAEIRFRFKNDEISVSQGAEIFRNSVDNLEKIVKN